MAHLAKLSPVDDIEQIRRISLADVRKTGCRVDDQGRVSTLEIFQWWSGNDYQKGAVEDLQRGYVDLKMQPLAEIITLREMKIFYIKYLKEIDRMLDGLVYQAKKRGMSANELACLIVGVAPNQLSVATSSSASSSSSSHSSSSSSSSHSASSSHHLLPLL